MITRRDALALLGGATLSSGCSRGEHGQTVLRFWAAGREGEVAAQIVKGFEAEHPDIIVNVQTMPFTAAHEKLLTAYAGDTLPDVCQLGNTWVPEFAALDALEPLDEKTLGERGVDLSDYFKGFLDANRLDGSLYGLPWYIDTRLLFYRRDLLTRAGWATPPATWDEWTEALAAVKALVGPDQYSILLPLNEYEPLLILALQQPAPLLRENGQFGNFQHPDFRRALEFYLQMFERDWAPRTSAAQISNVWDEFGKGFFSFYISGPWNIAEFKRRLRPELQDDWMTAPMPGPDGPGVSVAGGSSLVVFRSSPNKPQARALIEYLSRPQTQQRFYELTGDMPPRESSWRLPTLASSPYAQAFRAQVERVRSPPKVPEWERIATELRLTGERVVHGVVEVDEALVALDRRTDEILEKRRWLLSKMRASGE